MARFKAPKNFGGFTHAGETYKAKKGIVELPDDMSHELAAAHGLTLDTDEAEPEKSEPESPEGAGE